MMAIVERCFSDAVIYLFASFTGYAATQARTRKPLAKI